MREGDAMTEAKGSEKERFEDATLLALRMEGGAPDKGYGSL